MYLDKSKPSVSLIILGLFLIPNLVYGADWYNSDWQFSKSITVNSSLVDGVHTDFPLLVNLTDADLLAGVSDVNGLDILFTTENNETKLNHEVEFYNSTNGHLTAWVKLPLIQNASDTKIFMYYGDTGSNGNQNNTAAVWEDYYFVMHMGETLSDSSGNVPYSEFINQGTTTITTQFGQARLFDGINDYLNITDSYLDTVLEFNRSSQMMVTIWSRADATQVGTDQVWVKGNFSGTSIPENQAIWWEYRGATPDFRPCRIDSNSKALLCHAHTTSAPNPTEQWNQQAYGYTEDDNILNRQDWAGYINGTCGMSSTPPPCQGSLQAFGKVNNTHPLLIGQSFTGIQHYDGIMDEMRISKFEHSNEFLNTDFNQGQVEDLPNEFLSFGQQGTNPNPDYDTLYIRLADQYRNHIAMTTNTDTTTDLDVAAATWVQVPITGNVVFMDDSFFKVGNGIACNFDGRVKVTASLLLTGTGQRSESELRVLIDGVAQSVTTAGAYKRFSGDLSSPHITLVANCSLGDIITLENRQEGVNSVTTMAAVGSSMLLVERI